MYIIFKIALNVLFLLNGLKADYFKNNNFLPNRNTIVQLFEWKWLDIAQECEDFLEKKGFAGVQISPPNENLVINNRPWWERYQPVSYKLTTRSGTEDDFKNMTKRCNAVGIRIYADTIINHMSGGSGNGTDSNTADAVNRNYPAVPYTATHFNHPCTITNFEDPVLSRNCELSALRDLNQSHLHVRNKMIDFMNHLIDLGVAGFRIDAASHMWPQDLKKIYSRLKNLNTQYNFGKNARPFIYQEASNMNLEYASIAALVEFKYSRLLSNVFRGNDKLKYLQNWGPEWGLINGLDAVAFITNHDNQRHTNNVILTYKEAKRMKMATAFMLAHPYGTTRVLSGYYFTSFDQGPPADDQQNIKSPGFSPGGTCTNGWVCEHRWREIYNMVEFRNVAFGTGIDHWWSNNDQQIAFCRGNKAFIAFTNWGDIRQELQTCLPAGEYCDIISGNLNKKECTGKLIKVFGNGSAFIELGATEFNGVLAIHIKSKINYN